MSSKINYVNGMTPSIARKWFQFYFGTFFIRADVNEKELRLDIYLRDKVKDEDKNEIINIEQTDIDLNYFNNFWNTSIKNPSFKIMIVEGKTIEVN